MYDALSIEQYPNMDKADIGQVPNVGYGSAGAVRAHCIAGGATSLIEADIASGATELSVSDASRYPAAPFIVQVAAERMTVTAKDGGLFTVSRGADGTRPAPHARGMTVFEVRTEYVYLISPEPVSAVSAVYIDGVFQAEDYTAYTGRAGDEHPDYPGMAVLSFLAEGYIGRQRNMASSGAATAPALVEALSHPDLGSATGVAVTLGAKARQIVWAAFTGPEGVTSSTHEASVANADASDSVVRAVAVDRATGTVLAQGRFLVPGGLSRTVSVTASGGRTLFALLSEAGGAGLEVSGMGRSDTALDSAEDEAIETYAPAVGPCSFRGEGMQDIARLAPKGRALAWSAYPAASYGMTAWQTHTAELYNPGSAAARLVLAAVESDGSLIKQMRFGLGAGESAAVTLTHEGGEWDAMTKLLIVSGEARLDALYKEVSYVPEGSGLEGEPVASASARAVIGAEVAVEAGWSVDRTGDFGGLGTLIERPDRVIKHFLVARMGFALAEIDAPSFEAAGASYGSAIGGGYGFGFVINGEVTPSEVVRELAFQARSTLGYRAGVWHLDYLPDAAPEAVKTIGEGELAGEGAMFAFSRIPVVELGNRLTAYYNLDYMDNGFGGSVMLEDAGSVSKFGAYKREFEFWAVRDGSMAAHVLGHVLRQRASQLLIAEFPIFYGHFDLQVGDTVELDGALFGGRRFYIEEMARTDCFRARVRAREWWG